MNIALSIALFLIPLAEGYRGKDGDNGNSWGPFQITKACLADVNRVSGNHFTKDDCYDYAKARHIAEIYLTYWGARVASDPSVETYCRIHNGGPDGWKRPATMTYWVKCIGHWTVAAKNGELGKIFKR